MLTIKLSREDTLRVMLALRSRIAKGDPSQHVIQLEATITDQFREQTRQQARLTAGVKKVEKVERLVSNAVLVVAFVALVALTILGLMARYGELN